jgi:hypothetical protein
MKARLAGQTARVRALGQQTLAQYGPTWAAYDLKKFRGQQIVQRIGATRRYEAGPTGLKAITALVVLRDKAIKPLLAAAQELRPRRGAHNTDTARRATTTRSEQSCEECSTSSAYRKLFFGAQRLSA